MKLAEVRSFAMSLPEVTEEPHFHLSSFRVRGKIFVTIPPEESHLRIFVADAERERALAIAPECLEKLLWGGKVVGLSVALANAKPSVVKQLIRCAWTHKAPKSLATLHRQERTRGAPAVK